MLRAKWYVGPNTKAWLENEATWKMGDYYYSHLTDYLRFVLMYKYGGTYMDMDALWLKAPPSQVEFIGSDKSDTVASWFLDSSGTYLAPGVMKFSKGRKFILNAAEDAFSSNYDPKCFNCVGPKIITSKIKEILPNGINFEILPWYSLYPYPFFKATSVFFLIYLFLM